VIGPIIGRVGLDFNDPLLGTDFYIGTWYHELDDGTVIVNWASEVARLFFEGRASGWRDPDPVHLSARRTFEIRNRDLVAFADEIEHDAERALVFRGRQRGLEVPEPPPETTPEPVRPLRGVQPESEPAPEPAPEPVLEPEFVQSPPKKPPVAPPMAGEADDDSGEQLRNEELTRRVAEQPKTGRLRSVLGSLQPDQYRLVTWDESKHLVVQGHPGSGKTVVATHRAAWLTHPQRKGRLERVGLVGPNDAWANHVREVLDDLGANGVEVMSLETLVRHYSGGSGHQLQLSVERFFQVGWDVARAAERATRRLSGGLTKSTKKNVNSVLNQLVQETPIHREFVSSRALSQWLLRARNAEGVRNDPSYLLFLANVGLAVEPPAGARKFHHLIVDEVQDLRGAEWYMLLRFLHSGRGLSLFGDMNQRRSDTTVMSWQDLAGELEISAEDGSPFEPEVLKQGYRSTRQILEYASNLLDAADRHPKSLLEGPEPRVRRVGSKQLEQVVIEEAEALAAKYVGGRVAVIRADPGDLSRAFLRRGWRNTAESHVMQKDSLVLGVFRPANTRGLEYDGVVVVEPAEFPRNLGRDGRLYTALTRANKELTVIHVRTLPRRLRGRGNRE
jgi:DNA helicase IV